VAQDAIDELKQAIASGDVEAIQAKTTQLAQSSMKLGEQLYKQSGAGAAAGAGAGPDTSDNPGADHDDIVDADFEEVKDDDKKA
jgi:molecular chaperone DnaK